MAIKMVIINTCKINAWKLSTIVASSQAIICICNDWNENTLRMILTEHLLVIVIIISFNQDNPMQIMNATKQHQQKKKQQPNAEIIAMENV